MQGYRRFLDWIAARAEPVIVGFDSNHWSLDTSLQPAAVLDDPSDRWLLENQFFGANPPHRLRDAYVDYLNGRPEEYESILRERPTGPLAVSYVRGSKANPVEDRFDYVFISPEVTCLEAAYHYEAGVAAGSDHAPVTATLQLSC